MCHFWSWPTRVTLESLFKETTKRPESRGFKSHQSCVSVGQLGGREQGNLRKCSPSALKNALRNRGALGSAPKSALEGLLTVQNNKKSTLESTLGSTPESTPISESILESTRGALSEISLFSAP